MLSDSELVERRRAARDMEALTLDVILAFRGFHVGDYWRKFWSAIAIVTSAGRKGSMNHATVGAMVGLIAAIRLGDTKTIDELLDWWEKYFEYMRENLGGKESPHSRIYLVWVLIPVLHMHSYVAKQETRSRPGLIVSSQEWIESTVAYLSLSAIDEPAKAGKFLDWRHRETWKGFACAATGGRSWSTVNENTDIAVHLDLWRAEPILHYLVDGPGASFPAWNYYWGRDCIKEMERTSLYDSPKFAIDPTLRGAMRSVIAGKCDRLGEVLDAAAKYHSFTTFSYLRFEKGVACVMHDARGMSNSTAPMYAARHKKGNGELAILVVDNGGRDIGGKDYDVIKGAATISPGGKSVTAVRGPGPLEKGSVASATLNLGDLGDLVYWVKSGPKGTGVHVYGPAWPEDVPLLDVPGTPDDVPGTPDPPNEETGDPETEIPETAEKEPPNTGEAESDSLSEIKQIRRDLAEIEDRDEITAEMAGFINAARRELNSVRLLLRG